MARLNELFNPVDFAERVEQKAKKAHVFYGILQKSRLESTLLDVKIKDGETTVASNLLGSADIYPRKCKNDITKFHFLFRCIEIVNFAKTHNVHLQDVLKIPRLANEHTRRFIANYVCDLSTTGLYTLADLKNPLRLHFEVDVSV